MTKLLTTQLEVPFAPNAGGGYSILWEADPDIEPEDIRFHYARLYPHHVPIKVATTGTLRSRGTKVHKVEDVVVFSGDKEQKLRYPEAYEVSIKKVGTFYSTTGAIIPGVIVTYDHIREQLISSHEGYGVVEVEYKAKYESFRLRFSGVGCPLDPYADLPEKPFKTSVLVALYPTKDATATYTPTLPICEQKSLKVNLQPGAETPRIDLEIDPEFPLRLGRETNASGDLYEGCRIRHIPDIESEVRSSTGTIRPMSTLEVGRNLIQEVTELILFSGSSSVNIGYQSATTPRVLRKGTFRNKWGSTVIPEFRVSGQKVYDVERPSQFVKKNPKARIVGADEVVCTDVWGNTLEVFGVAEVSYTYTYRLFELQLGLDKDAGRFSRSFITALRYGSEQELNQPATLMIDPTSMQGVT